jgi:sporulation protein YlmC with PRC-barrel domain
MKRLTFILSLLMVLSLVLAACAPGAAEQTAEVTLLPGEEDLLTGTPAGEDMLTETPGGLGLTGTPAATESVGTPVATEAVSPTAMGTTDVAATEEVTGTPEGTEVLPPTGAQEGTLLSSWIGLQIVDQDGEVLGTVNDMILNMCEAHILYLVVDPDEALGAAEGQVLVPLEVITVGGGTIDAEQGTITVNLPAVDLSGIPTVDVATVDLETADWEADVLGFWASFSPLSLTTGCRVQPAPTSPGTDTGTPTVTDEPEVTGTPEATVEPTDAGTPEGTGTPAAGEDDDDQSGTVNVTKIALASVILQAALEDGNGSPMGQVEEILVEPETGRLRFVAIRLDESTEGESQLVLAPIGALNIRHEDGGTTLILLVEADVLLNAPTITAIPDPTNTNWEADAFEYWSEFVQMTDGGTP